MICPEDSIVLSKSFVCVLNAAEHFFVEGMCSIWMRKSRAKSSHGPVVLVAALGTGVAVPMLGWEAGGTGAEICRLCGSKWGRNSRWNGNGMGWAAQISLWDCRPIPSHPILVPHARPIQSHDHP